VALKNAIDFLSHEWLDKAAGFVAYGYTVGARAIESLRLVMSAVQVATIRPQVGLSLYTDFHNGNEFTPAERHLASLDVVLDHVVLWGGAMRTLRKSKLLSKRGVSAAGTARSIDSLRHRGMRQITCSDRHDCAVSGV
jgi:NAD(P)H-dependent FMN reductase